MYPPQSLGRWLLFNNCSDRSSNALVSCYPLMPGSQQVVGRWRCWWWSLERMLWSFSLPTRDQLLNGPLFLFQRIGAYSQFVFFKLLHFFSVTCVIYVRRCASIYVVIPLVDLPPSLTGPRRTAPFLPCKLKIARIICEQNWLWFGNLKCGAVSGQMEHLNLVTFRCCSFEWWL